MIAPVAAPHAAPWPTGVSHEVRARQTQTDARRNLNNFPSHSAISVRDIKLRSPPDVAGTVSRQPLSGRTGARDIQIRALHARPRLARHAQPSSSHTVDMADMGSLQLPKDHAGFGSQADTDLPLPGIACSASAFVIAVAVITG